MTYQLYWISGSPFAWRAQLALAIKGVEYESKLISVSEGEHKSDWFVEMNPRGKVPVMKDGETVIYESSAIITYLEGKHPEPPLLGAGVDEATLIRRLESEIDSYVAPAVVDLIRPIIFGEGASDETAVKASSESVHTELDLMEKALGLSDGPYLAGSAISAADISLFPFLMMLVRVIGRDDIAPYKLGFLPLKDRYPALAGWISLIEEIPGYDETYPPHWKE